VEYWQHPQLPAHYAPRQVEDISGEGAVYDATLQFRHYEFRFWALENVGANITTAVCRCCEMPENTLAERIKHQKKYGCTTTLVDAYKLLLKGSPMQCVMCDKDTTRSKFGIPICYNDECLNNWFFTPQPINLLNALILSAKGVV
jgi:hypothetical protein